MLSPDFYGKETHMLALGLILLLIGWIFAIQILFIIGVILLIVGAILFLASGGFGPTRPGGRRYW